MYTSDNALASMDAFWEDGLRYLIQDRLLSELPIGATPQEPCSICSSVGYSNMCVEDELAYYAQTGTPP